MPFYKSPEVEDHPLDWVDINHPLNRISLPFYNLALEIYKRRCLIASTATVLVAITIPALYFVTVAHLPIFHWVHKFMRLSWDTERVCFPDVGCFSTDPPFHLLPLPWHPKDIKVHLTLVTEDGNYRHLPFEETSILRSLQKGDGTKLVIHGYRTHKESSCITDLVDAIHHNVASKKFNIIVVDWYEGSKQFLHYYHAASNTRVVGAIVAKWLQETVEQHQYSLDNIHCIGHSLGAQVCSFVGKMFPLARITGLDPAGPGFNESPLDGRLDKSDAAFVDVIHTDTDAWGTGLLRPVGHVDIYPNGGHSQPDCEWGNKNLTFWQWIICDHMKSIDIFAQSYLTNSPTKAVPCANETVAKQGLCSCENQSCDFQEIGENSAYLSGRGVFIT